MSVHKNRSPRLLLFNLMTDADHPILGFTVTWINALAEHCEYIDVVTMSRGRVSTGDNVRVHSVGKEKGYGRLRRIVEFYLVLGRLLRRRGYDACFAHMMPLFAVMAAPLLMLRGIRTTLWYTHKSVTLTLRLAEKLVERVVTASPESFRIDSRKKVVVGHGIDTDKFVPREESRPLDRPFTILSVSRIAPVKGLEVLIEATRLLACEHGMGFFRVRLVGNVYQHDEKHHQRLRQKVAANGLQHIVEFVGPVPHDCVPGEYQGADVAVNLSRTGSLDKAVLEAMSCGVPVITSNEAFYPLLKDWRETLLVPAGSAEELSRRLMGLFEQSIDERRRLGAALRGIVEDKHRLGHLIGVLISYFSAAAES